MKNLIIIACIVISGITTAQTNFEKGMAKAFELWEADKTDEAENMFVRIATAEPNQWLPNYYIAQINSIKSWNIKNVTVLKAQLKKAQEHLDLALATSPDNAELLVMQAQVYTNWVAYDGMTYGMKYSGKINQLYAKALEIAPKNPRVVFNKADWSMNSAKYFGKDIAPYCEDIKASIELFDTFTVESDLHPTWGKKRAEQALGACKS